MGLCFLQQLTKIILALFLSISIVSYTQDFNSNKIDEKDLAIQRLDSVFLSDSKVYNSKENSYTYKVSKDSLLTGLDGYSILKRIPFVGESMDGSLDISGVKTTIYIDGEQIKGGIKDILENKYSSDNIEKVVIRMSPSSFYNGAVVIEIFTKGLNYGVFITDKIGTIVASKTSFYNTLNVTTALNKNNQLDIVYNYDVKKYIDAGKMGSHDIFSMENQAKNANTKNAPTIKYQRKIGNYNTLRLTGSGELSNIDDNYSDNSRFSGINKTLAYENTEEIEKVNINAYYGTSKDDFKRKVTAGTSYKNAEGTRNISYTKNHGLINSNQREFLLIFAELAFEKTIGKYVLSSNLEHSYGRSYFFNEYKNVDTEYVDQNISSKYILREQRTNLNVTLNSNLTEKLSISYTNSFLRNARVFDRNAFKRSDILKYNFNANVTYKKRTGNNLYLLLGKKTIIADYNNISEITDVKSSISSERGNSNLISTEFYYLNVINTIGSKYAISTGVANLKDAIGESYIIYDKAVRSSYSNYGGLYSVIFNGKLNSMRLMRRWYLSLSDRIVLSFVDKNIVPFNMFYGYTYVITKYFKAEISLALMRGEFLYQDYKRTIVSFNINKTIKNFSISIQGKNLLGNKDIYIFNYSDTEIRREQSLDLQKPRIDISVKYTFDKAKGDVKKQKIEDLKDKLKERIKNKNFLD